jgi:hypothetical protein
VQTKHVHKRISSNTTTNITDKGAAIKQIQISVASAGTSWKLRIQDRASPNPAVLIPDLALSAPTAPDTGKAFYDVPIPMENGIDVVTPSGTPGVSDVWIAFEQ